VICGTSRLITRLLVGCGPHVPREYLGDEQIVYLRVRETPVVAKLPVEQRVAMGETREFAVPREKIYLFDAESEERVRS
jgi:hypothetical protein